MFPNILLNAVNRCGGTFLLAAFLLAGAALSISAAAPGDLDPTFGNGGKIYLPANDTSPMELTDVAIQPDGKIVGYGRVRYGAIFSPNFRAGIVRLNADGSIDAGFGNNGRVLPPNTTHISDFCALDLQPADGKIVLACRAYPFGASGGGFTVYRYNANGTPDTSFGTGGIVYKTLGSGNGSSLFVRDLIAQPNGKILVAGDAAIDSGYNRIVLARFNSDGSLDASFGSGGIATPTPEPVRHDYLSSLLLLPNGKIIVTGLTLNYDFFLLFGFNADGTRDASFGVNGELQQRLGNFLHYGSQTVLLPDGKFILYGGTNNPAYRAVFMRYSQNGTLDTSYGTNGIVVLQFAPNVSVGSPKLQPNGKLIMAGSLRISESFYNVAVTRVTTAGVVDTSFGTGGYAFAGNFGIQGSSSAATFALQPDGKIVVAGTNQCCEISNNPIFARFLNNGVREYDFEGDRKADFSIFRPNVSAAEWYWLNSSSNQSSGVQFGIGADKTVAADYDGDGKADIAVFRNGDWYRLNSSDNQFVAVHFGQNGDVPVAADYDNDNKADLAVYRQGDWYILNSADNSFRAEHFGVSDDKPIIGDFDGDGKNDLAVYRTTEGTWYAQRSRDGFFGVQFGINSDKPVAADYDGDGKTDFAVYRPAEGTWYLLRSNLGFTAAQFGIATDRPSPADYDGDGKTDLGVYRDGGWYVQQSTAGFRAVQFGTAADRPIPNSFVP